jgi:uncharacterized damage-inducible protein DinB
MIALLSDLLNHQFWADGEMWEAIGAHAPPRADRIIHDRLHHIHQVQRFFIWAVGDRAVQLSPTKPDAFPSFEELREYASESHQQVHRGLAALTDARLAEAIEMPWFRDPPLSLTVAEALTQMAMHSQHHRGQNATRLRELGAVPPTVDLIVWYWKGRPPARPIG